MHTFLSKTPPIRDYISKKKSLLNITEIANELPKLLLTNNVQNKINKLKVNELSVDILLKNKSEKEINLAMSHLSFIAHAFMWGGNKPEKILPEVISKPWVKLSKYLGRPPILSYASYCLDNWYKVNQKEPISLNNVALINNFLGGVDEDWFVTIHVCIEDAAGDAIDAAYKLSRLNESSNVDDFNTNLKKILMSLKNVNNIFSKILRGEIPCKKIYEDEFVLSFHDINPQKKIHALVIPKGKYVDLDDFSSNAKTEEIIGLIKGITIVAKKLGISVDTGNGYRALVNISEHGGQEVPHLHFHLFGGEPVGKMVQ